MPAAGSEAVAADVDGLQVGHLHDVDAAAGQAGDALRQMASMATMLVAMSAEGVAPPLPSAAAAVSMGTAETFMATLVAPPFLFWWVLMCLERWSLRMKRLGHSGQANFFSPGGQGEGG